MQPTLKKNVCIVTAARSEYGLLRWVIDELTNTIDINTQIIVTGAHLLEEQGLTFRDIEKDGYTIDAFVDMNLDVSSTLTIAQSMGYCAINIAEAFDNLKPDLLVVLGDRYELLPICSTAVVMNIPIAHISGGDVTEGAIDDSIRNAITMLSSLHFPGSANSYSNIVRMIDKSTYVYNVGELSLDNFKRINPLSRSELSDSLGVDPSKPWVLFTYHPETKISVENNLLAVQNILKAVVCKFSDAEIIVTKANTDIGGLEINKFLHLASSEYSNIHLFDSLGQLRYVSILSQIILMIGNSSSGIFETPFFAVPTVNVGNRQKGRYITQNIIATDISFESIIKAISIALSDNFKVSLINVDNPYGDGNASMNIVKKIKEFLNENTLL